MLDVLGAGLHPHRPGQGADPAPGAVQTRSAHRADPDGDLFAYGFGALFTGAMFTEKIFGWHGMGEWLVQGIATQDINIVAAITVFAGVAMLLAGLLADILYAALDPRVRVR